MDFQYIKGLRSVDPTMSKSVQLWRNTKTGLYYVRNDYMEKITNNNGVDNRYMLLYEEPTAIQYSQYRSHLSSNAKLIEPLEMLTNRIQYQKGVWKLN